MPAARCFQLLALNTLLLVGALLDVRLAWVALALDLVVVVGTLVDFRRAARVPLQAARRWPPLLVQGAPAEVVVTLTSPTSLTSPTLGAERRLTVRLREGLHPALAESPLRHELTVPPRAAGGEARWPHWSWALVPRRRGEHRLAPLTVREIGRAHV